jgi:DNA-directed RNA polymerase subunit RPC12/RpoP
MPITQSVTLICSACGRTFEKPRSTVQKHSLVACPHCATLQAARQARDTAGPHASAPLSATVWPTYRKGP